MKRFTTDFSQRPMTQMNLRLAVHTADAFRAYCAEYQLTQNEALTTLLLAQDYPGKESAETSYIEEINRYQSTITDLTAKYNHLLKHREMREETYWRKTKNWAAVIREMLDYVIERAELGESKIKPGYFKRDHKRMEFSKYLAPTGSGCMVVRLDHLLYSKGRQPALFILTHKTNEQGEKEFWKFRWYPDPHFVGFSPKSTKYSCSDTLWLIGYTPASDGAAGVIAALPLDAVAGSKKLRDELKPESPLDARIQEIEKRKSTPKPRHFYGYSGD